MANQMISKHFSAKFHQRRLPPTVPRRPSRQVTASGPNDPDPALDFRAVFQGAALRHPLNLYALLHLRNHRNAGKMIFHTPEKCSLVQFFHSPRRCSATLPFRRAVTPPTTDTSTSITLRPASWSCSGNLSIIDH